MNKSFLAQEKKTSNRTYIQLNISLVEEECLTYIELLRVHRSIEHLFLYGGLSGTHVNSIKCIKFFVVHQQHVTVKQRLEYMHPVFFQEQGMAKAHDKTTSSHRTRTRRFYLGPGVKL